MRRQASWVIAEHLIRDPDSKYDVLEAFLIASTFNKLEVRLAYLNSLLEAINLGAYRTAVEQQMLSARVGLLMGSTGGERVLQLAQIHIFPSSQGGAVPERQLLMLTNRGIYALALPTGMPAYHSVERLGANWTPAWELQQPRMPIVLWAKPYAALGNVFVDGSTASSAQFMGLAWRTDLPVSAFEQPLTSPRILRKKLAHLPPATSIQSGSDGGVPLSKNCDLIVCRSAEAREALVKCLKRMTGLGVDGHSVPVVADPWFAQCVEAKVGRKKSLFLESEDSKGFLSNLFGGGTADHAAVARRHRAHVSFRTEPGGGIERILKVSAKLARQNTALLEGLHKHTVAENVPHVLCQTFAERELSATTRRLSLFVLTEQKLFEFQVNWTYWELPSTTEAQGAGVESFVPALAVLAEDSETEDDTLVSRERDLKQQFPDLASRHLARKLVLTPGYAASSSSEPSTSAGASSSGEVSDHHKTAGGGGSASSSSKHGAASAKSSPTVGAGSGKTAGGGGGTKASLPSLLTELDCLDVGRLRSVEFGLGEKCSLRVNAGRELGIIFCDDSAREAWRDCLNFILREKKLERSFEA